MGTSRAGLGLGLVLALGCAGGEGDSGPPIIDTTPGDGDSTGMSQVTTTGIDDGSETMDGSSSTGTADDTTSGSTDGSTGEPMGTTGPMGPYMCDNMTSCAAATPIGGVAGDEASTPLQETGEEPTWVEFQVAEQNSDAFGEKLSFTATLSSPPGYNFDLYLFRGPEAGNDGCGGIPRESTNENGDDTIHMEWGEGTLANNTDDSVWVAVEIRAADLLCEPGAEWTLTVTGDT